MWLCRTKKHALLDNLFAFCGQAFVGQVFEASLDRLWVVMCSWVWSCEPVWTDCGMLCSLGCGAVSQSGQCVLLCVLGCGAVSQSGQTVGCCVFLGVEL